MPKHTRPVDDGERPTTFLDLAREPLTVMEAASLLEAMIEAQERVIGVLSDQEMWMELGEIRAEVRATFVTAFFAVN
jgi:hypothetical protein